MENTTKYTNGVQQKQKNKKPTWENWELSQDITLEDLLAKEKATNGKQRIDYSSFSAYFVDNEKIANVCKQLLNLELWNKRLSIKGKQCKTLIRIGAAINNRENSYKTSKELGNIAYGRYIYVKDVIEKGEVYSIWENRVLNALKVLINGDSSSLLETKGGENK